MIGPGRCVALLALTLAIACGGKSDPGGPQTAAEKMRLENKDSTDPPLEGAGKKWGNWRYQGDRDSCFYVFGRKCFDDEKSACAAAACKQPQRCTSSGAGPAMVTCK